MGGAKPGFGAPESPVPARDFEAAHAELLADRSIQFELKGPDQAPPRAETRPSEEFSFPSGSADAGPIALTLFWIVVGLAAAGLLYLIIARVAGWRRAERLLPGEAAPDWQIASEPARQLLGDADALAAAGRYSEAAHLLLHRSIAEIDRRRPASVRKALTSRDIAVLPNIPPSPAAAFGAIVRLVEHSLFGGRPLNARDWGECRSAYERFAFAGEWQR